MDLGMFDRFYPSLKTRVLIDERRFDMSRSDKNSEKYVIPMHRKNVWTNKCMQDPRKKCLQVSYHDPSAQYRKGWGSFKRKRGLTLCYSCRKPGHLAKECPGRRPSCLCCKAMDHEVLDCPRMIAKLEEMNMRQENPKADPETKIMTESQKESEKVLLQMKETLNDHRHVRLSEIFKEKECLEARIGDFDIDCVLDEETQVNIMTERTWEAIGRPAMIPSLGGIGLFKGKLINLCGKLTQIPMNANGTSTEEDFEIIKFIENSAPFTMLLGKPWIERDQARRQEEEEVLEQKKQELKEFMTRRITHLIEEQKNRSKLFNTRDPDVEVARTLEDPQKIEVPIPDKEEGSPSNLRKESQQREVTMPKEDKNQNGKRHTETKLTGKKARKLSKKRAKIDKLQKVPEGTSQKENLQNWSFVGISEQRHMALRHGEAI
jgi:hypothetical protein